MPGSEHDAEPLFPAELVFVVALRRDSETGLQRCAGRIEQLVSGRSVSFRGSRELFRFIAARVRDHRR